MAKFDKNEILVLTGAFYTFIAYLAAFILEVWFVIDLAKRNIEIFSAAPIPLDLHQQQQQQLASSQMRQIVQLETTNGSAFGSQMNAAESLQAAASSYEAMQTLQTHVTISCLAMSILYFLLFVASLLLIVALIIKSSLLLLIWMCLMTTLYLPEFGLAFYVSIYGWGLESRNGQTELIFYLFRALLNVICILLVHRLWKLWQYEKNFFILKKSSRFTGYDSPFFVGDPLSTTINPIFSSLNMDRYDHIRASTGEHHQHRHASPSASSNGCYRNFTASCNRLRDGDSSPSTTQTNNDAGYQSTETKASLYSTEFGSRTRLPHLTQPTQFRDHRSYKYGFSRPQDSFQLEHLSSQACRTGNGSRQLEAARRQHHTVDSPSFLERQQCLAGSRFGYQGRENSVLSINELDDLTDCELDLDYRTLTNQRHQNDSNRNTEFYHQQQRHPNQKQPSTGHVSHYDGNNNNIINESAHISQRNYQNNQQFGSSGNIYERSKLSYSTQSLDRRHLKDMDYLASEQVILRPLGHRPFDYLKRPGSTSNLDGTNINYQPRV